ncbi:hypothetical protein [Cellulophaga tyrosinoxydans]|uniref:hypothetical protein n=1 Tax=Cellulophaga tyrosinoxydans TaxID=504486 RepID=UPI0011776A4B|nr:hypothetical protein [Cellulophaga tyrosinoxydans]
MKKNLNRIITILFSLFLFSCARDKIVYEFYPAFITPIHYTIDIEKSILSQNSKQLKIEGHIQGSNNLINEEYQIDRKVLNTFLERIESVKLDSSIQHNREVLDGISFRFSKINQWNDSISLISTSPNRQEKYLKDYQILDAFFALAHSTIKNNNKGQSLTENIQDYFHYTLPIKRVSNNPIEYRVAGRISGCRDGNEALISLLDSLPNNEPIIFDIRNGSFAPCLTELLEEFEQKKRIYYYGIFELNQIDLDIETLEDELSEAEKDNSNGLVGGIRRQLKELRKDRKRIIAESKLRPNSFRTKHELRKTIANIGYNK